MNWKQQLQSRINSERAECVRMKKILDTQPVNSSDNHMNLTSDDPEYEKLVEHYLKENSLLEQKRILLQKEIFDENLSLIQMQVELAMKQLVH
jgi:RalA-binding protein 1